MTVEDLERIAAGPDFEREPETLEEALARPVPDIAYDFYAAIRRDVFKAALLDELRARRECEGLE